MDLQSKALQALTNLNTYEDEGDQDEMFTVIILLPCYVVIILLLVIFLFVFYDAADKNLMSSPSLPRLQIGHAALDICDYLWLSGTQDIASVGTPGQRHRTVPHSFAVFCLTVRGVIASPTVLTGTAVTSALCGVLGVILRTRNRLSCMVFCGMVLVPIDGTDRL